LSGWNKDTACSILVGPCSFESHSTIELLLYHAIQSVVQGLLVPIFVATVDNLLHVPNSGTTLGGTETEASKKDKHEYCQGQNIANEKILRFGRARQFQLGSVTVREGDTTIVLADGAKGTYASISYRCAEALAGQQQCIGVVVQEQGCVLQLTTGRNEQAAAQTARRTAAGISAAGYSDSICIQRRNDVRLKGQSTFLAVLQAFTMGVIFFLCNGTDDIVQSGRFVALEKLERIDGIITRYPKATIESPRLRWKQLSRRCS
jgi:hypothetical protein